MYRDVQSEVNRTVGEYLPGAWSSRTYFSLALGSPAEFSYPGHQPRFSSEVTSWRERGRHVKIHITPPLGGASYQVQGSAHMSVLQQTGELPSGLEVRRNLGQREFEREYLEPMIPAILEDSISDWKARSWTVQWFKDHYPDKILNIDGKPVRLGDYIDELLASDEDHPAPYLRNIDIPSEFPELLPDISRLSHSLPTRIGSRLLPRNLPCPDHYMELFIGGPGSGFPGFITIHHLLAFVVQIFGRKEVTLYAPDQARSSTGRNWPRIIRRSKTCSSRIMKSTRCGSRPCPRLWFSSPDRLCSFPVDGGITRGCSRHRSPSPTISSAPATGGISSGTSTRGGAIVRRKRSWCWPT